MKKATALTLILAQVQGAFAALPGSDPSVRTFHRIGIVRAGSMSKSHAQAYPLLERNLQKWMENRDDLRVIGEPLSQTVSTEEWNDAAVEAEVMQLVRQLPEVVSEEEKERAVSVARNKVTKLPSQTPLHQRLLVADALWDWRHGRKEQAARVLRQAVRLHPTGEVNLDWDDSDAGFLGLLSTLTARKNRGCLLDLSLSPESARVTINGFPLTAKEYRSLLTGKLYRLRVDAPGYVSKDEIISCQTSRRTKLSIHLAKGFERTASLSEIKGYQTLLLIKPEKDRFRLFLYSQDRAMDEIPLERPLRVADLGQSFGGVPVSDAAAAIFQKHRLDLAANFTYTNSVDPVLRMNEPKDDQWYNDWRVWAIAGGVVAGGVVAYLMTKNGGSVGTQNRIGVKIE